MSLLRAHIGRPCPSCGRDILQAAPPRARMPPGDFLWCPACEAQHTLATLEGEAARRAGFLRRLFGKPGRA